MTTFAGDGNEYTNDGKAKDASFNCPFGITVNQHTGDIYVTEICGGVIRKISQGTDSRWLFFLSHSYLSGQVSTLPQFFETGDGDLPLNSPGGICYSVLHNSLFIADVKNHLVRKLDLATGIIASNQQISPLNLLYRNYERYWK